jgi:hypothetical protein
LTLGEPHYELEADWPHVKYDPPFEALGAFLSEYSSLALEAIVERLRLDEHAGFSDNAARLDREGDMVEWLTGQTTTTQARRRLFSWLLHDGVTDEMSDDAVALRLGDAVCVEPFVALAAEAEHAADQADLTREVERRIDEAAKHLSTS